MALSRNVIAASMAFVFAMSSVGCGQGFRTGNGSSNAAASASIDDQMAKAKQASQDAETAMVDAKAVIDSMTDDQGNIKLDLFKHQDSQTTTTGLLSPIIDKLNTVFDKLFAKIDSVKAQLNSARAILADAMSKLPAGDSRVDEIKAQLAKIDALELTFRNQIHALAGKLDLAVTALDKLISTATSFIPIPGVGVIAGVLIDLFIMGDVKTLIENIKMKLLAV